MGAALFCGLQSPIRLYATKGNEEYPAALPAWREARQQIAFIDLEKATYPGRRGVSLRLRYRGGDRLAGGNLCHIHPAYRCGVVPKKPSPKKTGL
jgi:hypothetical protein